MRDMYLWWTVFMINFPTLVICVPIRKEDTKLEISDVIQGINLTPIIETVVKDKNFIPRLITQGDSINEKDPGKNDCQKKSDLAESITQGIQSIIRSSIAKENIQNIINSPSSQKILISSELQKQPGLFEKIVQVIMDSVKYATTIAISKMNDVRNKGLLQTVSETVKLHSRDLDTTPQSAQRPQTEKLENITNYENNFSTGNEVTMETRDIRSGRLRGGRDRWGRRTPWFNGFFHDYNRDPYFDGPLGVIRMILERISAAFSAFWEVLMDDRRPTRFGRFL